MLHRVFQRRVNLFNLLVSIINALTLLVVGMVVPSACCLCGGKTVLKWNQVKFMDVQWIISCLCSSCESSMV